MQSLSCMLTLCFMAYVNCDILSINEHIKVQCSQENRSQSKAWECRWYRKEQNNNEIMALSQKQKIELLIEEDYRKERGNSNKRKDATKEGNWKKTTSHRCVSRYACIQEHQVQKFCFYFFLNFFLKKTILWTFRACSKGG